MSEVFNLCPLRKILYYTFSIFTGGINCHGAVYAKNKRLIFVFGGFNVGSMNNADKIGTCEIDKNHQWTKLEDADDIYGKAFI